MQKQDIDKLVEDCSEFTKLDYDTREHVVKKLPKWGKAKFYGTYASKDDLIRLFDEWIFLGDDELVKKTLSALKKKRRYLEIATLKRKFGL